MFKQNAIISYQEKTTTQLGNDPITGEPIFEESSSVSSFYVSIDQAQAKISELSGKDITGIYCEGRAVLPDGTPTTAPDWYQGDMTLDIAWDDGKTGKFYSLPVIESRLGLDSFFGAFIKGIILNNQ
ncbi:MAG: hypothetical protein AB4372_01540 [Xenococcus sp. (in: cyanobacteria)]